MTNMVRMCRFKSGVTNLDICFSFDVLNKIWSQWPFENASYFRHYISILKKRRYIFYCAVSWESPVPYDKRVFLYFPEIVVYCCLVAKSCPIIWCPCGLATPPGSSVHGISKARILEVDCYSLLQGIFLDRGSNPPLLHWQADSLPLNHQETFLKLAYLN